MAALSEALNAAEYGYDERHQDQLAKRKFVFSPVLPVSRKSTFGGTVWDYTDESNARLKVLQDGKLKIDWAAVTKGTASSVETLHRLQMFQPILPEAMIEDIKIGVFMYGLFPALTPMKGLTKQRKAISVVYMADAAINLFGHIYYSSRLSSGSHRIERLSDIRLQDIIKYIPDYPYDVTQAKKVLYLFAILDVSENLKHGPVQWHALDIRKSNKIKWPKNGKTEPGHYETLPNALFRLLSNASCDLVGDFLFNMDLDQHDVLAGARTRGELRKKWPLFKRMFESYVGRRERYRQKLAAGDADRWEPKYHTMEFMDEFGVRVEDFYDFLFDVHVAAQVVILLYTGMRYSEAASIKTGCLVRRDSVWLIVSTLIKAKPSNLPIDDDEWVAIDIVRDAVRALEELSRFTFNEHLFSNCDTVRFEPNGLRGHGAPLSNGGLNQRITEYLRRIDKEGHWTGWTMTEHQCRHGLVNQMARADVGLPFITRQLKHHHGLLAEGTYRINPTSIIYGMQKERLMANSTGMNAMVDAKEEVIMELYGEGRKFAGPGAPAHQQRTEAFFEGQGLHGNDRERYIRQLARRGIQVVKTGIGYCTRNHVAPERLKEDPPPCIGDLECNPYSCKHSVVPESNKPVVVHLYKDTLKNLADPEMAHLQRRNERQKTSLESMLGQLGVDPAQAAAEEVAHA